MSKAIETKEVVEQHKPDKPPKHDEDVGKSLTLPTNGITISVGGIDKVVNDEVFGKCFNKLMNIVVLENILPRILPIVAFCMIVCMLIILLIVTVVYGAWVKIETEKIKAKSNQGLEKQSGNAQN